METRKGGTEDEHDKTEDLKRNGRRYKFDRSKKEREASELTGRKELKV